MQGKAQEVSLNNNLTDMHFLISDIKYTWKDSLRIKGLTTDERK